jgi:hypothetical protein
MSVIPQTPELREEGFCPPEPPPRALLLNKTQSLLQGKNLALSFTSI